MKSYQLLTSIPGAVRLSWL